METIQIIRQYRFIDPDKAFAQEHGGLSKSGKWVFNWDTEKMDEATDKETGYILPGEYIIECRNTNATKAVEVKDCDKPTTREEADSFAAQLNDSQFVEMIGYVIENKEKEAVSAGLMERHESPEKAAKRLEKKQAKAATELQEWMNKQIAAGQYPSQEAFNDQLRKVYGKYELELPNQQ